MAGGGATGGGVRIRTPIVLCLLLLLTCLDVRGQETAPLYLMDSPFDEPMITRIFSVNPADGELMLRADLGTAYSPFYALAAANELLLYAAGTDNTGTLCSRPGCLLLRITLDPVNTTPAEITVVGSMRSGGQDLGKVTGLTFRNTGDLYATDQDSESLYIIDPETAQALFLGTVDLDIHGGDLTFTADDRLFLWTNLGPGAGIYEVDPATALATAFQLQPDLTLAGLAALGHSNLMWGSSPTLDSLVEIDATLGITGTELSISLSGAVFDHKRGDLGSPYCNNDLSCDDANTCTGDICSPGGCNYQSLDLGQSICGTGTCLRTVENCLDGIPQSCTPGQPDTEICDGLDNDCDGLVDNNVPPPAGNSGLSVHPNSAMDSLEWTPAPGAISYDISRGNAVLLHSKQGDFSMAMDTCLVTGLSGTSLDDPTDPAAGEIFFYLVRPANCGGTASYDSLGPGQVGSRDTSASAAPGACP